MRVDTLFSLTTTEDSSASAGQFQGEIGKREEFILTLDKIIPIEIGYAVAVYLWCDRNENQFVWFASKDCFDYQVGQEYRIRATVKRHQNYKGIKQTAINRLKLIQTMYKPFVSQTKNLTGHEQDVNEAWESL